MEYTHSLVLIVPAEYRATVEAAGAALGHTGSEYNVPLSPTGQYPATHWGLRAWATAQTAYAWTEAPVVPPLSAEQVAALRALLIMSAVEDPGDTAAHFDSVAASAGLMRIIEDGEI